MSGVFAFPPTPSAFYGTVKNSNGNSIPNGYIITAKINNVISGTAQVIDGKYGYGSNPLIVLAYDQSNVGEIKFYIGDKKIGEHEFIDLGVTNLNFIADNLPDSGKNPIDDFCDVATDECRYNALDCNPDKTDACAGNGRCDSEVGEDNSNTPVDCKAPAPVSNPGNSGGSSGGGGGGGGSSNSNPNVNFNLTGNLNVKNNNPTNENKDNENENSGLGFLETTTPPTTFSRITGAVVGTLGMSGTIVVIVFIVAVLAGSVAVRIKRKRG